MQKKSLAGLQKSDTATSMQTESIVAKIRPLILSLLLLLLACGGDPDVTVVDFSQTIRVDRPDDSSADAAKLRVAVAAMISPRETVIHYHRLLDYIAARLDKSVHLVQRKTYGEISEMLGTGRIDVAFICSGPYATDQVTHGFEALAVPEIRGKHLYQSYLIVNKSSSFRHLSDLKGGVFAFTDPGSNTGKLVPTYWLAQQNKTPERYFGKIIYTFSHDNSIMAVANSLVDAAAVHGQIWEYYSERDPLHTAQTRVIKKSIQFGNPLMVAAARVPTAVKRRIRKVLLRMHRDADGKVILGELLIDRFIAPQDQWYEPIRVMKVRCSTP